MDFVRRLVKRRACLVGPGSSGLIRLAPHLGSNATFLHIDNHWAPVSVRYGRRTRRVVDLNNRDLEILAVHIGQLSRQHLTDILRFRLCQQNRWYRGGDQAVSDHYKDLEISCPKIESHVLLQSCQCVSLWAGEQYQGREITVSAGHELIVVSAVVQGRAPSFEVHQTSRHAAAAVSPICRASTTMWPRHAPSR